MGVEKYLPQREKYPSSASAQPPPPPKIIPEENNVYEYPPYQADEYDEYDEYFQSNVLEGFESDDSDDCDYPEGYDYPDEPPEFYLSIEFTGEFTLLGVKSSNILYSTSFRDIVEDALELHEMNSDSSGYLIHCREYPDFCLDDCANYLNENITLVCEKLYEPVNIYTHNRIVGNMATIAA
jgi:hypothetical protein